LRGKQGAVPFSFLDRPGLRTDPIEAPCYHIPAPKQPILRYVQNFVIEDEVNVSAFIKRGLEEQSYQVDVAYDGATGKSLALQKGIRRDHLDVILPNSNGWEVCKSIRA
jgi:response regulator RpfG family c-di-GMP phosphodiesterase